VRGCQGDVATVANGGCGGVEGALRLRDSISFDSCCPCLISI